MTRFLTICAGLCALTFCSLPTFSGSTANEKLLPHLRTSVAVQERYFLLLGSYDPPTNDIELAHTFGIFFRAIDDRGDLRILDLRSISWLPASEIISVSRPAEKGVNKSIADTLAWAEERNIPVVFDGPYETTAELYHRAVAQIERMERGELKYKCFDRFGRDKAKNCMHAISDLVEDEGRLYTNFSRGHAGTLAVAHHLNPQLKSNEPVDGPTAERLFKAANIAPAEAAPVTASTNVAGM